MMRACALACMGLGAVVLAGSAQAIGPQRWSSGILACSRRGQHLEPQAGRDTTARATAHLLSGIMVGSPSSYSYVWRRDGAPIPGQSASSYTVQGADRSHALSCTVTAVNQGGEYLIQALSAGSYEIQFSSPYGGNYLSRRSAKSRSAKVPCS